MNESYSANDKFITKMFAQNNNSNSLPVNIKDIETGQIADHDLNKFTVFSNKKVSKKIVSNHNGKLHKPKKNLGKPLNKKQIDYIANYHKKSLTNSFEILNKTLVGKLKALNQSSSPESSNEESNQNSSSSPYSFFSGILNKSISESSVSTNMANIKTLDVKSPTCQFQNNNATPSISSFFPLNNKLLVQTQEKNNPNSPMETNKLSSCSPLSSSPPPPPPSPPPKNYMNKLCNTFSYQVRSPSFGTKKPLKSINNYYFNGSEDQDIKDIENLLEIERKKQEQIESFIENFNKNPKWGSNPTSTKKINNSVMNQEQNNHINDTFLDFGTNSVKRFKSLKEYTISQWAKIKGNIQKNFEENKTSMTETSRTSKDAHHLHRNLHKRLNKDSYTENTGVLLNPYAKILSRKELNTLNLSNPIGIETDVIERLANKKDSNLNKDSAVDFFISKTNMDDFNRLVYDSFGNTQPKTNNFAPKYENATQQDKWYKRFTSRFSTTKYKIKDLTKSI